MSMDASVLDYMARFGLHPGEIKWTGKLERFLAEGEKGSKRSGAGWYIAHADPPQNVRFGSWKTGVDEHWWFKNGKRPDEFSPEEWAKAQEEAKEKKQGREEELLALRAKTAEECQARWEKASEASPTHPYLKKKDIPEAYGIKQEGSLLLIPMKSFELGAPIVSIQEIDPKGHKKFVYGGKTKGVRTTIGAAAHHPEGTIYIAEGWATGATIHMVTGAPVVVAFTAHNLTEVANQMRFRQPAANIIIASDNDRWSHTPKGPNPGVLAAHEAAKEANVLVAIPDFKDLTTHPTDFNDLYILEGRDAVIKWLDPVNQNRARIMDEDGAPPPQADSETSPEEKHAPEPTNWTERAPFRVLGYNRGSYYYLPRESGQPVILTLSGHDKMRLLGLAPLSWWEEMFPQKNGCDWLVAADALIRSCHRAGVFDLHLMRGRGAWTIITEEEEEEQILLHLGDRILPPSGKRFVEPEIFVDSARRVYERLPHLDGPSLKKAMPLETAKGVLDLFRDLLWYEQTSGILAAGWTVLAPLGGALPWRPHIWLTGGTGAGKTTVLKDLMVPFLSGPAQEGGMCYYFDGGSTEAGMRQTLRADSLPIIYDEAERDGNRADLRIQTILGLARGASSTGQSSFTAKGTTQGQAVTFHIRSMFCIASIGGAIRQEADKTRFCMLQLKSHGNLKPGEKNEHWAKYEPRLKELATPRHGRELIARTMGWVRDGRMEETIKVFRRAASHVLGQPRLGDQYGVLYSGAWTLMADEPPDEQEAREVLGSENLNHYIEDQAPEGAKVLEHVLQAIERVDTSSGVKTLSVGELVGIASGEIHPDITSTDASSSLRKLGVRVEMEGAQKLLFIANSSKWIERTLRDTPYANVGLALQTLSGVTKTGPVRFHSGLVSRCSAVPLEILDQF